MKTDTISLFGLGKLGLCLAALHAATGRKVLGVDILDSVVQSVNAGISPIVETGLDKLIARVGGKTLVATTDARYAMEESDISIILTATPSMPDGSFSNCQVESALAALAQALKTSDKQYHLFVISSTVMPGSIENSFIPLIERQSGRKLGEGFDICFLPDFVSLGNVIHDFQNPDVVVIGESSPQAGDILTQLHMSICTNNPPVHRMSLSSAELAKVSLNAYITLKISFANIIGNICEKLPNADPDAITAAIGEDKRISPHYFRAGLSFGGTCFPRDTWAFTSVLSRLNLDTAMMDACNSVNKYQDRLLAQKTLDLARKMRADTVSIIGLAFKPNSPVIVESAAIKLVETLLQEGLRVTAYDALALDTTKKRFGEQICYAASVQQCFDASACCVLTLPSKELVQEIATARIQEHAVILDPWRVLKGIRLERGTRVLH